MHHGHVEHTPGVVESPRSSHGPLMVDALSCSAGTERASEEVCDRLESALRLAGLHGPLDFAITFFTADHAPHAAEIERRLAQRLAPRRMIACSAQGLLAGAIEVESGPGLCVLGGVLPGVQVQPFGSSDLPQSLAAIELGDDDLSDGQDLSALASACGIGPGHRATVVLGDPFTTPIDSLLSSLSRARALSCPHGTGAPGDHSNRLAPIVGGFASGSSRPGGNTLVVDGRIQTSGCVGLSFSGAVRADCIVSQGCRPVGPNCIVTSAKGQFIQTLGGRPALTVLEEIVESLDERERALVGGGLLIGRVVNEYKGHFGRGDYLMRAVVGVLKGDGAIAVGDRARVGQTIRFHVRDKATAHEDLSMLLDAQALHGPPLGALVFSCNGRGSRLFGHPNHDSASIQRAFAGELPAEVKAKAGTAIHIGNPCALGGFFAAGEFGPVGDRSFLHGQTLSALLFRKQ